MKGHTIQLSRDGLKNGNVVLAVHPSTKKRAEKAIMNGKGMRLALTPHECECSGEGLRDVLKKVGKYVKKGVKAVGRDKVKDAIHTGLKRASMIAPGPVQALVGEFGDEAVDFVMKKMGLGLYEFPNINMAGVRENPVIVSEDGGVVEPSRRKGRKRNGNGGSFKPSGFGYAPAGY